MAEDVRRAFERYRRRDLRVRAADAFLEAAFALSVAAAALLLADRLAFETGLAEPLLGGGRAAVPLLLGGALAAAALYGAGVALLRPTPRAVLAWRVDRAAGGEERFLSALELVAAGPEGPFATALRREALEVARRARPDRVCPRAPIGYRWGILLALAAGGALWAFPARLYPAPVAGFEAEPRRGPAPLPVTFRDASVGAIQEFVWDFGDGAVGSGEEAAHVYARPGRYAARLRLRGPGGASEAVREIEVLPPDRAAADFRPRPARGRAPLEVRFENLSRNAARFRWDFGDGRTSEDREPVHVFRDPGTYTVQLRAANDLGEDETARPVRVLHPEAPLADFRALPREGEAPLSVHFEDLSTGALSAWEWDFGDPTAGEARRCAERNPTFVYRHPGRYAVRLRVRGPHGEDEEEKLRYIHVREPGSGPGGGGGEEGGPEARWTPPAEGRRPLGGRGEGDPPAGRPKVTLDPQHVRPYKAGEDLVEKDLRVLAQPPEGEGRPREGPLEQFLPHYKRAAEDSVRRERIPPPMRDYIRRYYESLAPR
jgi:PKD repeat protein